MPGFHFIRFTDLRASASGIKGMTRAWAETVWLAEQGDGIALDIRAGFWLELRRWWCRRQCGVSRRMASAMATAHRGYRKQP